MSRRHKLRRIKQELASTQNIVTARKNKVSLLHKNTLSVINESKICNTVSKNYFVASLSNDRPEESHVNTCDSVNYSLSEKLSHWLVKHKISQNAGDELLQIFREEGYSLPLHIKTLLKTDSLTTNNIIEMPSGQYFHFGIFIDTRNNMPLWAY